MSKTRPIEQQWKTLAPWGHMKVPKALGEQAVNIRGCLTKPARDGERHLKADAAAAAENDGRAALTCARNGDAAITAGWALPAEIADNPRHGRAVPVPPSRSRGT